MGGTQVYLYTEAQMKYTLMQSMMKLKSKIFKMRGSTIKLSVQPVGTGE